MAFDPYSEWLGIPVGEQPPTLYRLVGVADFEPDETTIREAALRRAADLRKYQAGVHSDLTQKLLNELSQARVCLLDPAKKRDYDLQLQLKADARARVRSSSGSRAGVWAAVFALLLAAGVGGFVWMKQRPETSTSSGTESRPESVDANPSPTPDPTPDPAATKKPDVAAVPKDPPKKDPANVAGKKGDEKAPSKGTNNPPPQVGFVELKRESSLSPLGLKVGEPVNLAFLNTPASEDAPCWADARECILFFNRIGVRSFGTLAASRRLLDDPFGAVGKWNGLPEFTGVDGITWSADGLTGFAGVATAGKREIVAATRISADGPLTLGKCPRWLESDAAQYAPRLSPNGLTLYFSRVVDGRPELFESTRSKPGAEFDAPEAMVFPPGFEAPSLTGDGQTMYLHGPNIRSPVSIYRSQMTDRGWSAPALLREIVGFRGTGQSRDQWPLVSGDGRTLVFASNREGGKGGLDLWIAAVSPPRDAEKGPALASNRGKDKPTKTPVVESKTPVKKKPKTAAHSETPIEGPIAKWLMLGPLSEADAGKPKDVDALAELLPKGRLSTAPVDKELQRPWGKRWKLASSFDGPGVYLLAFPFRCATGKIQVSVEKSPGGAVGWLNKPEQQFTIQPTDLWHASGGIGMKSDAVSIIGGRHRLYLLICVAEPASPLVVRILNGDTGEPLEGASASF